MSITNYPDADFTPDIPNSGANTGKQSYNPTGSFRFWAQKVLPTVYDDSLSYYEILTKVVNYLNSVIQNVDSLNESVDNTNSAFNDLQTYVNSSKDTLIATYNELQSYVNTYFDSLDVQEEINAKLNAMASDGSLSEVVSPFIPSLVSDWLSHNITPTSPAIDASLSISGAGADAKVTGEQIADVKSAIDNVNETAEAAYNSIYRKSVNLFDKEGITKKGYYGGAVNGIVYGTPSDWNNNNNFQDSGLIAFDKTKTYATNISNKSVIYIRYWDADKKFVGMRTPSQIKWNGNVFAPNPDIGITPSFMSITMDIVEDIDTLMVCLNELPTEYEPYGEIRILLNTSEVNTLIKSKYPTYGKKLGCLGDSITYGAGGTSWVTKMAELCGFSSVINYGVSGSCISDVAQDGTSFIERYPDMADDLDYLTVWGGVNDIKYRGATASEFQQKYETLIRGIRTKLPYCKILILTPMKFDTTGDTGSRTNRWDTARLHDSEMPVSYVETELDVAEKYCIKAINMWTSSGIFVDLQKTQLMPDGIHPNTLANLSYLAPLIANALKSF